MTQKNVTPLNSPKKTFDLCLIGAGQDCFDTALSRLRGGAYVSVIVPCETILSDAQQRDFSFLDKDTHIVQALYAAGETARAVKRTKTLGLSANTPELKMDWRGMKLNIQNTLERIAPYYSAERLRALGAEIVFSLSVEAELENHMAAAELIDLRPNTQNASFEIEGLGGEYLESINDILSWPKLPEHLTIIGAGAVALSVAQALGSLGCTVAVIAEGKILPACDSELFKILYESFEKNDKIRLIEGADISHGAIDKDTGKRIIHMEHLGAKRRISAERVLLIAQGDAQESALVTLTQPAIAAIGLSENAARERFGVGNFHLVKWRLQDSSFALSQNRTEGLLKMIAQTDGTLLAAGYCGESAAEVIALLSLALEQNLKIQDLKSSHKAPFGYASLVHEAAQGYNDQVISKLSS